MEKQAAEVLRGISEAAEEAAQQAHLREAQLTKEKAALVQQAAELQRLWEEEKVKSAQAADKADDEAEKRELRLQKFKKAPLR